MNDHRHDHHDPNHLNQHQHKRNQDDHAVLWSVIAKHS